MKKNLFLAIFAFVFFALPGIFTSCSQEPETTSIKIPVDTIFRSVYGNEQEAAGTQSSSSLPGTSLRITVEGAGNYNAEFTIPGVNILPEVSHRVDVPVGISLAVTAAISEDGNTTYSGTSEKITTVRGENTIDITMKKILSSVTVKTEAEGISGCDISLAVTDGNTTKDYTPTADELIAGYEIKYLAVGGTFTITAEAKSDGTVVYRGGSEVTVAKNDNTCTLKMEKVESSGSIEVKQLPQSVLLELMADTTSEDTITELSLKTATTAYFKVSHLESGSNSRCLLPDWVTYTWKLNDNTLEIDGTIASFNSATGYLTLDITKVQTLIVGQNQLSVEISAEGSTEVTAAAENFTVTKE